METPTKDVLIKDLKTSFGAAIEWINQQPESNFNAELAAGRWTIAEHLYHLIKSTKGVTKGYSMPKEALESTFGLNNRKERSFEEMASKYNSQIAEMNITPPGAYAAESGRTFDRQELVTRFEGELEDFIKSLDAWEEDDMGKYVIPHPVMGNCTIREFVYFTTIHTNHHLEILKRYPTKLATD